MASTNKDLIRHKVWPKLREVAVPDSRFHYDFSSFIADFKGSENAITRLIELPCFIDAKVIFITPDNCLEGLRSRALQLGKIVLVTTYAIRRGFWLLDPTVIDTADKRDMVSMLDGMESKGLGAKPISLLEMLETGLKVDLMVTGTGAINQKGIRFGKGHGFFDLEWAMLFSIGVVDQATRCVAVVHECQILEEELDPEIFDTACEIIVTSSRIVDADTTYGHVQKPHWGILWDMLQPGMLEEIPPLQELKKMKLAGELMGAQRG